MSGPVYTTPFIHSKNHSLLYDGALQDPAKVKALRPELGLLTTTPRSDDTRSWVHRHLTLMNDTMTGEGIANIKLTIHDTPLRLYDLPAALMFGHRLVNLVLTQPVTDTLLGHQKHAYSLFEMPHPISFFLSPAQFSYLTRHLTVCKPDDPTQSTPALLYLTLRSIIGARASNGTLHKLRNDAVFVLTVVAPQMNVAPAADACTKAAERGTPFELELATTVRTHLGVYHGYPEQQVQDCIRFLRNGTQHADIAWLVDQAEHVNRVQTVKAKREMRDEVDVLVRKTVQDIVYTVKRRAVAAAVARAAVARSEACRRRGAPL